MTQWTFGQLGGDLVFYDGAATSTVTFDATTDPTFFPFSLAVTAFTTGYIQFVPSDSFRVTGVCYYTSATNDSTYADAFYSWELDEDGQPINISLLSGKGLYLDNAAVAIVPPYNPNHEYTFVFEGTGNPIQFRFEDAVYSDNQSAPLYLSAKGPGAGS